MPNYYAHLKFGDKVLDGLPQELARMIDAEREAFDLGCLGPDPLFFYQPIRPNAVRREGVRMHRNSALPAVERLRQAIEDQVPMSVGYGAGFLCHLALDSACHGYVDERAAEGPISHMAMESEFDRMLIEEDGLDSTARAHLPSAPEKGSPVWGAAAQAYTHATPRQMRRAYRAMSWYLSFFARSCGRPTGKVIGAVSRMLPIQSAKNVALSETPHPASLESSADLDRLLEGAVDETTRQINAFFQAIWADTPVPHWFDRDFKGTPPESREAQGWAGVLNHSLT